GPADGAANCIDREHHAAAARHIGLAPFDRENRLGPRRGAALRLIAEIGLPQRLAGGAIEAKKPDRAAVGDRREQHGTAGGGGGEKSYVGRALFVLIAGAASPERL